MESNYKRKVKGIFLWTLRKYMPISIAYWVLLFLAFPVFQLFTCWMIVATPGESIKSYTTEMTNMPEMLIPFILVAIVMSSVISFVLFSYMHNKRCVDFFGSLPVGRRTTFMTRYLAVLFMQVIPIILFGILGSAITLSIEGFITDMQVVGILAVTVWGNCTLIAFISLCSGTVADMVISYLALNISYPICIAICGLFPAKILPGMEYPNWDPAVYTFFAPMGAAFTGSFGGCMALHCIWWIALCGILVCGSLIICKKRKAETAQNSFTFSVLSNGIKFIVCFGAGFGFGWMLAYMSGEEQSFISGYIWFFVGLIIGVMVSNILLHLIFNKGFSNYGKSLKLCGMVMVVATLFMISITTGGLGYDTYVPTREDVAEVAINYQEDEFYVGENNILENYSDKQQDIENIISLHQEIVASKSQLKKRGFYSITGRYDVGDDYNESEPYVYGSIKITYVLKSGGKVTRYYMLTGSDKVKSKGREVLSSQNQYSRKLLSEIPAKYLQSSICTIKAEGMTDNEGEFDLEGKVAERFLDALRKDYDKNGAVEGVKYIEGGAEYDTSGERQLYMIELDYEDARDNYLGVQWVIDDSYKETMNILKELDALNFYYIELKNKKYEIQKTEYDKNHTRTIYFQCPKSWDGYDVKVNLISSKTKLPLWAVKKEEESCEKIQNNIWKCEIPVVDGFDRIVFYQSDYDETDEDDTEYDADYWISGGIELEKDASKNYLVLDEDKQFNPAKVVFPEPCYQYEWKTFESKDK